MNKEQILTICDNLIDQLTVLKGFMQLNNNNRKADHSIILLREMDNIEKAIRELVDELMTQD